MKNRMETLLGSMVKTAMGLALCNSLVQAEFIRDDLTETVYDTVTTLQWQDDALAATDTTAWQSALDRCEAMTLAGYSDWRLPNQNELRTLVDRTLKQPALNGAFLNGVSYYYWSSTSAAGAEDKTWLINFTYGYGVWGVKTAKYYVRCVRGQ